jgi:hypothetical protein
MEKNEAYHHVRFRWWTRVQLEQELENFQDQFEVVFEVKPVDKLETAIHKDDRNEMKVKSDTLTAYLSPFRVVLNQKKKAPFTSRDVELRKRIIEIYPRERPTPFPWLFSPESAFEIVSEP